ncbi:hypothetical protein Taro_038604 [Colocasia esculenta]|uniref:Uncharacterized protein n=1 Tax=Colocasia esculenta TaxID=4460 RepID=A0A843WT62_COLES|nr:hypothetical protein [Colocasia esculenta]
MLYDFAVSPGTELIQWRDNIFQGFYRLPELVDPSCPWLSIRLFFEQRAQAILLRGSSFFFATSGWSGPVGRLGSFPVGGLIGDRPPPTLFFVGRDEDDWLGGPPVGGPTSDILLLFFFLGSEFVGGCHRGDASVSGQYRLASIEPDADVPHEHGLVGVGDDRVGLAAPASLALSPFSRDCDTRDGVHREDLALTWVGFGALGCGSFGRRLWSSLDGGDHP